MGYINDNQVRGFGLCYYVDVLGLDHSSYLHMLLRMYLTYTVTLTIICLEAVHSLDTFRSNRPDLLA